jgi:hypothetical protein
MIFVFIESMQNIALKNAAQNIALKNAAQNLFFKFYY